MTGEPLKVGERKGGSISLSSVHIILLDIYSVMTLKQIVQGPGDIKLKDISCSGEFTI